jgi:hypothetical protein
VTCHGIHLVINIMGANYIAHGRDVAERDDMAFI